MVYPTHGAGSLCSAGIASTSWSTIGFERRHDPLLAPMEIEAFARALLAGQPTFPRYFARMRPINQAGPRLLGGIVPEIPPLADAELDAALGERRPRRRRPAARRLCRRPCPGLAVDPGRRVVRDVARLGGGRGPADRADRRASRPTSTTSSRQALRIGYEATAGHVAGGFDGWRRAGRPVEPGAALDVDALAQSAGGGRTGRPVRHRRPPARRSTKPATSRARSTSARATCPRCSSGCRPTDRSRRSAPAATARASPRRCCARPASSASRRSAAASRTGRRTAIRSTTAPAPTASSGRLRPRRAEAHEAHAH